MVRTRFAPAPTGWLHLGHVLNAEYVWGAGAEVILRIEDHDRERCRPEYDQGILEELEESAKTDRRNLEGVNALFKDAFPDLAADEGYIERKLVEQTARGYPCILLVAEGPGDHIIGFALTDFFERHPLN